MRKLIVLIIAVLVAASTTSKAFGQQRPKIAVMRFQSASAAAKDKIDQATAELTRAMAMTGKFQLSPTLNVHEQQEQLSTDLKTGDPEKIAPKLGKKLDVDWVFIPYVTMDDGYSRVTITVINITTTEQPTGYSASGDGTTKDLYEGLMPKLAKQAAEDPQLFTAEAVNADKAVASSAVEIPGAVLALLKRADMAIQRGRTAEALTVVHDAQKQAPENPEVLSRCIGLFVKLGKPEDALGSVRGWLKRIPASHPHYDEMLKKSFDLEDQINKEKRIAEQSSQILIEFNKAAEKKDGVAAATAYQRLKALSPSCPALRGMEWEVKALIESSMDRKLESGQFADAKADADRYMAMGYEYLWNRWESAAIEAIHRAIKNGDDSLAITLLREIQLPTLHLHAPSFMLEACRKGLLNTTKAFLEGGTLAPRPLLPVAAATGNVEMVEYLLSRNDVNRDASDALIAAAEAGHDVIVARLTSRFPSSLPLNFALAAAAEAGHEAIVARLLAEPDFDILTIAAPELAQRIGHQRIVVLLTKKHQEACQQVRERSIGTWELDGVVRLGTVADDKRLEDLIQGMVKLMEGNRAYLGNMSLELRPNGTGFIKTKTSFSPDRCDGWLMIEAEIDWFVDEITGNVVVKSRPSHQQIVPCSHRPTSKDEQITLAFRWYRGYFCTDFFFSSWAIIKLKAK